MRKLIRIIVTGAALAALTLPLAGRAADPDPQQKKLDELAKELEALKQQVKKDEEKSLSKWLTVSGDYRFRLDSLKGEVPAYYQYMGPAAMPVPMPGFDPENGTLMTNRFGLNLKAKATRNVTVTTRLLMNKTSGMQTADATNAGFFADRMSVLDGTIGHIPTDNVLRVDQVFATWSNIFDQPVWFSVGRRPSTGGSPTHVRQNGERPGNGGVPGLLVDYAFDGMTLGWAPEIDALPGAFAKLCYGRGFEAGYSNTNDLKDTDMVGVQVVPVDTDPLRVDFQWNRGFNIFDDPNNVGVELGDIDWYGVGVLSTLKGIGPGSLTSFASGGVSITHPNGKHMLLGGMDSGAGLLTSGPDDSDRTGWGAYAGLRYDLPAGTKIGGEYNHGSKYWMPFDPAADDLWTSKLGTRGNVYEAYLIQELPLPAISSFVSKAFFKVGWQYYDFDYTGSNNWIGAPVKISELMASPMNAQMLPPMKSAQDFYGTFEVRF
ncbi:conserved hypothetical protein [Anaeromyxobacter dehalogenans 2CP-1]|uniref:DUF3373 domain-containing protein n=1 Tax=Anaeromyxobacter dehalogenans (strain ATCC BAA-258 / DSM 21875 / 2CP-1) TaxID=455488 RepID=B8JF27_ANAD2|nr:DUF3373 domain-containing protein [Anaeromyxobacter dehalogenans]ACL64384.1 conserved hypothetical protein [Anaeromyxobacter dehalogenans 2CP-1]